MSVRLAQLVNRYGGRLQGEGDCAITGIATLQTARAGELTFLANPRYHKYLATTEASAVLVSDDIDVADCPASVWVVANPYAVYARVAQQLYPPRPFTPGIHPAAVIEPGAEIDPGAWVGANCYVSAGVRIAAGSFIGPGCVLDNDIDIGADTRLVAGVMIPAPATIGRRCLLHPGVVIGADGFGFANDNGEWVKIPQIGTVIVGDDVEIGANTTIDRAALEDTVIGDGVKLDNQIQIGHNVHIGAHTAIAACTAIAGSTRIGSRCAIGGCVGIVGHLEIADGVQITGMSMITHSLKKQGVYSSGIPAEENDRWRRNTVRLRNLDDMARRIRELERTIKNIHE